LPKKTQVGPSPDPYYAYTHYGINDALYNKWAVARYQTPSKTFLVADSRYGIGSNGLRRGAYYVDRFFDTNYGMFEARHGGNVNVTFIDGHAETLRARCSSTAENYVTVALSPYAIRPFGAMNTFAEYTHPFWVPFK
jgi:prepilin-type processing-associated H-X9-DG protein